MPNPYWFPPSRTCLSLPPHAFIDQSLWSPYIFDTPAIIRPLLFTVHDALAWLNNGSQLWPDYGYHLSDHIKEQTKSRSWNSHVDFLLGQPVSFQTLQSQFIILSDCLKDPLDVTDFFIPLLGLLTASLTAPKYFLRFSPELIWGDLFSSQSPVSALRQSFPKLDDQVTHWSYLSYNDDQSYADLHGKLSFIGLSTALSLTLAVCHHTQAHTPSEALRIVKTHLRSSLITLQGVFQYATT